MSKKPNHLASVSNIFSSLNKGDSPPSPAPVQEVAATPPPPVPLAPVRNVGGRPRNGKKSDPNYCQTTFIIRKSTRKRVQQILLEAESERDVSDLVEDLLNKWLDGLI